MSWLKIPTTPGLPWFQDSQEVIRPILPRKKYYRFIHNRFSNYYSFVPGGLFESFYSLLLWEYIDKRTKKLNSFNPIKARYNLKLYSNLPTEFKKLPFLQGLSEFDCSISELKDYPCPIVFAEKACVFNLMHLYQEIKNKFNVIQDQFVGPRVATLRNNMLFVPGTRPYNLPITFRNLSPGSLAPWLDRNPQKKVLIVPDVESTSLHDSNFLPWTPQDLLAFQQMAAVKGYITVVLTSVPQVYRQLKHVLPFSLESFLYLNSQAKFMLSKSFDFPAVSLTTIGATPIVSSKDKDSVRQLSRITKYHPQPLHQLEKLTPATASNLL